MIVLESIALSNNFQEHWVTTSYHTLLTPHPPEGLYGFRKPSTASGQNCRFRYHLGAMWSSNPAV